MGLFNKKKNNTPVNTPSASSGNESPQSFYTSCLKDYHDTAKKLGYAERDMIFIPELLGYGQKAVLWFLKNDDLQRQIPDPANYYYVAVNTAIRCGILFGLKWHLDFGGLQAPGYVESVMETGPSVLSKDIIKKDLGMDDEAFGEFCQAIFMRWLEMHKPYWEMRDPREYTFNATLAAYQLGVSTILCKYGF